jgi:type II secretory pathway pseudopilin PulG
MPLGIALILIFILYLIDKHGRGRQAIKITVALIVLAILGVGGVFGWQEYETRQAAKQAAQREAEETKLVAQRRTELAKACEVWEDKHPIKGGDPWEEVADPPTGCKGPLETAYNERVAGPWNKYAKTSQPTTQKKFGNAHVAPDSAILWNGGTMITTVFFGNRVKVIGGDPFGYRVQIADGRTGVLTREEVELDKGVVIAPDPK